MTNNMTNNMINNREETKKAVASKRVSLVSIKMVKEKSVLYKSKYNDRKISSPEDVVSLCKQFIEDIDILDREIFVCIYNNTKNEPNLLEVVSKGSLNASIVHPREVMKSAILSNANSMIFVHVHPSGDPYPSQEDKNITERLVEVGNLIGIEVLDHVIIGDENRYYSFKEEGIL